MPTLSTLYILKKKKLLEFFATKNAHIANSVLAVLLEIELYLISHLIVSYGTNKEGNCKNIWECNVGNCASIAISVCFWKKSIFIYKITVVIYEKFCLK